MGMAMVVYLGLVAIGTCKAMNHSGWSGTTHFWHMLTALASFPISWHILQFLMIFFPFLRSVSTIQWEIQSYLQIIHSVLFCLLCVCGGKVTFGFL